MYRCLSRIIMRAKDLAQDKRGVSAVEFSLLAPFLVMGAISTVDAGMAVYDKMMITQVLRSGAHSAIAAESEAQMPEFRPKIVDRNHHHIGWIPVGDHWRQQATCNQQGGVENDAVEAR
ncbi:MAG: TadE/TadG family type IV pilus assembly protein [Planctomycetota bacterium]